MLLLCLACGRAGAPPQDAASRVSIVTLKDSLSAYPLTIDHVTRWVAVLDRVNATPGLRAPDFAMDSTLSSQIMKLHAYPELLARLDSVRLDRVDFVLTTGAMSSALWARRELASGTALSSLETIAPAHLDFLEQYRDTLQALGVLAAPVREHPTTAQ
jgi:hypothetical protein